MLTVKRHHATALILRYVDALYLKRKGAKVEDNRMSNDLNEQMEEYTTFVIKMSDGKEHEFAIVEEFDFEEKHYILVSEVKGDEITEGVYLFHGESKGEDFFVEEIEDKEEYARITAAYEALYQ